MSTELARRILGHTGPIKMVHMSKPNESFVHGAKWPKWIHE
jgi:hypothetical protein